VTCPKGRELESLFSFIIDFPKDFTGILFGRYQLVHRFFGDVVDNVLDISDLDIGSNSCQYVYAFA
jgi:hypothetical protein